VLARLRPHWRRHRRQPWHDLASDAFKQAGKSGAKSRQIVIELLGSGRLASLSVAISRRRSATTYATISTQFARLARVTSKKPYLQLPAAGLMK
jgi:hypothetical protein